MRARVKVNGRKRSAAITLVLAGSAVLGGCGKPAEQRDAYSNMQSCVQDWGDSSLCEPVKDGRYSTSYMYGPPYYASGGWGFWGRDRVVSSPNAMEATRLPQGTVASSPSAMRAKVLGFSGGGSGGISRGGSSGSSSSVSRGGFGSSGHASSSGS